MGFGGAASAMITSLKNNNRRQTRDSFQGFGGKMSSESKCSSEPISDELRERIRTRVQRQAQKRSKRIAIFSMLVIGLLVTVGIYVFNNWDQSPLLSWVTK